MKKMLYPMLCAAGLLMAGCTANTEATTLSPSPSPSASASVAPTTTMPMTSNAPMVSPGTNPDGGAVGEAADALTGMISGTSTSATEAAGVTSAAQAKRLSEQAEEDIEKLSEVSDAQVVIAGHRAAVALEFDSQYQGGVDERLRKMVQQRIDGLVKGVTEVSVTDDTTLYGRIEALGDKLDGAAALSEIENELKDIITGIEA